MGHVEKDYLDFEDEIEDIDGQILELKSLESRLGVRHSIDIWKLTRKRRGALKALYLDLNAEQTTQVAQHKKRPVMQNYISGIGRPRDPDYISGIFDDWLELRGDRRFEDDRALIGGFARIGKYRVVLLGHNKTRGRKEIISKEDRRLYEGRPNPGGFRKFLRLIKMAEKYGLPVVTLIDTPGVYVGVDAEERGQASAIADNLKYLPLIKVPIVSLIIGEGGASGALGVGVANQLAMVGYSYYSNRSYEQCKKDGFSENLMIRAGDNLEMGTIEEIVLESVGGAHREPKKVLKNARTYFLKSLKHLCAMEPNKLINQRIEMIDKRAEHSVIIS